MDEKERLPALIPGLDLLNHTYAAKVTWEFSAEQCCIKNNEVLRPGAEVFNNYGPKSNEELLIAYGFCLQNNKADYFGIGFNQATSSHITEVLTSRKGLTVKPIPSIDTNPPASTDKTVLEQHKLFIDPDRPEQYGFTEGFVLHSSIAVENAREVAGHRIDWAADTTTLATSVSSRNQLHVVAATTILLEKSLEEVSSFDKPSYRIPTNHRQSLCRNYRDGQVSILRTALRSLHRDIDGMLSNAPINGIVRLDYILSALPPRIGKDIRGAVHDALGTRKPDKIREMGAEECVFTLFLYAVLTLQKVQRLGELPLENVTLWLESLGKWYPQPENLQTDEEIEQLSRSYAQTLETTVAKHTGSLYRNGDGNVTLAWCLHVVRGESIRVPVASQDSEAGESEMVLFMEVVAS